MGVEIHSLTPLIEVFDMPRSLAFYRDVLGFEVLTHSGDGDASSWVWMHLNECHLMLNDQYEPGHEPDAPPVERVKWHEDICMYFGCPNPDTAYEYLKAKGVDVTPPKNAPYGMRQIYMHDPDATEFAFNGRFLRSKY